MVFRVDSCNSTFGIIIFSTLLICVFFKKNNNNEFYQPESDFPLKELPIIDGTPRPAYTDEFQGIQMQR
jgi:hypothetical protein